MQDSNSEIVKLLTALKQKDFYFKFSNFITSNLKLPFKLQGSLFWNTLNIKFVGSNLKYFTAKRLKIISFKYYLNLFNFQ